jgi:hypothetical protein
MDPTRVKTNQTTPSNKNHHLIKFLVLNVPYEIKNGEDEIEK